MLEPRLKPTGTDPIRRENRLRSRYQEVSWVYVPSIFRFRQFNQHINETLKGLEYMLVNTLFEILFLGYYLPLVAIEMTTEGKQNALGFPQISQRASVRFSRGEFIIALVKSSSSMRCTELLILFKNHTLHLNLNKHRKEKVPQSEPYNVRKKIGQYGI